jgi:hypothetical protein
MKAKNVGFTLFISVFIAVGFGILGWSVHSWVKFRQAEKWPAGTAIIESCRFVVNNDPDGTSYQVETRYSYVVDGISDTGDRIAFGYSGSSNEEEVRDIYNKLSNANKVQVKYNPLRPEECVLASGPNKSSLVVIICGLTWLLFVVGFTFLFTVTSGKNKALLREITVIESKIGDTNHASHSDSEEKGR